MKHSFDNTCTIASANESLMKFVKHDIALLITVKLSNLTNMLNHSAKGIGWVESALALQAWSGIPIIYNKNLLSLSSKHRCSETAILLSFYLILIEVVSNKFSLCFTYQGG